MVNSGSRSVRQVPGRFIKVCADASAFGEPLYGKLDASEQTLALARKGVKGDQNVYYTRSLARGHQG